jgi:hypothetical protein
MINDIDNCQKPQLTDIVGLTVGLTVGLMVGLTVGLMVGCGRFLLFIDRMTC